MPGSNNPADKADKRIKDVAERVRSLRQRMDRIGIARPGYRINDPAHGRIALGDSDKDTHAAHLAPRR